MESYGMKHYSTIKKEILLLVTKFFDFEGVILNERSQKKTNTLALLLCVEVFSFFCFFLKNDTDLWQETRCVVTRWQGMEGE